MKKLQDNYKPYTVGNDTFTIDADTVPYLASVFEISGGAAENLTEKGTSLWFRDARGDLAPTRPSLAKRFMELRRVMRVAKAWDRALEDSETGDSLCLTELAASQGYNLEEMEGQHYVRPLRPLREEILKSSGVQAWYGFLRLYTEKCVDSVGAPQEPI